MIAYAGREITTLVEGTLSKSEGKTPRQVYSEIEGGLSHHDPHLLAYATEAAPSTMIRSAAGCPFAHPELEIPSSCRSSPRVVSAPARGSTSTQIARILLEMCRRSHRRREILAMIGGIISEVPLMDDEFYKERARCIREIATEADPFIKNRLLRLASHYDAMTRRTEATVLSSMPDASADSFAENDRGHEQ